MFIALITFLNNPIFLLVAALTEFSRGFWYGVVVTLLFGFIVTLLVRFWKKVSIFFKSTRVPATNPGPSPLQRMMGCVMALLIVLILLLIAAYLLGVVF